MRVNVNDQEFVIPKHDNANDLAVITAGQQALAARGSPLQIVDAGIVSGEREVSFAWVADARNALYVISQKSGSFHTWLDCGKTAETITGMLDGGFSSNLNNRAQLVYRSGTSVRTRNPGQTTLSRENFIRRRLSRFNGQGARCDASASPKPGEAFLVVIPDGVSSTSGYRYHWATVIMRDTRLNHVITLESCAVTSPNEMACVWDYNDATDADGNSGGTEGGFHVNVYSLASDSGNTFHDIWTINSRRKTLVVRANQNGGFNNAPVLPAAYTSRTEVGSMLGTFECTACDTSLKKYSARGRHPTRNRNMVVRIFE